MLTLIGLRVAVVNIPQGDYAFPVIMLVGISLHVVQYFMLRAGYYRATAYFFVATIFAAIHMMALAPGVGDLEAIFFVGVVILCSVLFLSLRATLILAGASLARLSFSGCRRCLQRRFATEASQRRRADPSPGPSRASSV